MATYLVNLGSAAGFLLGNHVIRALQLAVLGGNHPIRALQLAVLGGNRRVLGGNRRVLGGEELAECRHHDASLGSLKELRVSETKISSTLYLCHCLQ